MKRQLVVLLAGAVAAGLLLGGCRNKSAAPMPNAAHPRIVSYSPALTDMLFGMGLGENVVGVTTQCILPEGQDRPRVGDAFRVSIEPILAVKPELLLIQVSPESFKALQSVDPGIKIEHFKIERLGDIPTAMERIGSLAGKPQLGRQARKTFEDELAAVDKQVAGKPRPRVLFVMGYKQPSTGGRDTFVDDMIQRAGGVNAAGSLQGWQSLNIETIFQLKPDVIYCWVDAAQEKPDEAVKYWLSMKGLPAADAGKVFAVSDRYWTIPSPRLPQYVAKLAADIHAAPAGASQP